MIRSHAVLVACAAVAAALVARYLSSQQAATDVSVGTLTTAAPQPPQFYRVACADAGGIAGCHTGTCGRGLVDDFITAEEVETLRRMAERGMAGSATAETGGPVILDVRTAAAGAAAGAAECL
jgi:hypothetical protein